MFLLSFNLTLRTDLGALLASVVAAEEEGWTAIMLGGAGCPFDPISLLAAVIERTQRIGLVAAVDTDRAHPYDVARRLASLDHLSEGRAAWKPVSRQTGAQAASRIDEFVDVVCGLWDGWEDDAHLYDKAAGHYVDVSKVHPLHHAGAAFRVSGPIDIPRPPQGRPPLIRSGDAAMAGINPIDVIELSAGISPPARIGHAGSRSPLVIVPDAAPAEAGRSWLADGRINGIVIAVEPTLEAVAAAGHHMPLAAQQAQAATPPGTLRAALGLARPVNRHAGRAASQG